MKQGRHFTASVFIVHNNKVLLHKHKRFGLWLPVGGYLEDGELPHEAAIREAREEVALDIEIVHSDLDTDGRVDEIPKGEYLNLITINNTTQQVDFTFFAKAKSRDVAVESGIEQYKWLSVDDIQNMKIEAKTRKYAIEAIARLKNK